MIIDECECDMIIYIVHIVHILIGDCVEMMRRHSHRHCAPWPIIIRIIIASLFHCFTLYEHAFYVQ